MNFTSAVSATQTHKAWLSKTLPTSGSLEEKPQLRRTNDNMFCQEKRLRCYKSSRSWVHWNGPAMCNILANVRKLIAVAYNSQRMDSISLPLTTSHGGSLEMGRHLEFKMVAVYRVCVFISS